MLTEKTSERRSSDRVHRSRFEVDEDRARDILARLGFVEVDRHALKLKVRDSFIPEEACAGV